MRFKLGLFAAFLLCAAVPGSGCATQRPPEVKVPEVPAKVADLDDFADALNNYWLIPLDHPQRAAFRARLHRYLRGYIAEQLKAGDPAEALSGLEYALTLYTPGELRTIDTSDPKLATLAERVYKLAARKGHERPALFALAIQIQVGDEAVKTSALERWQEIEGWVLKNSVFATEPLLRHEELEESFEEIAAVFPSPFLVERLTELYLARYEQAVRLSGGSSEASIEARNRAEITGYMLIRLYLRADDIGGVLKVIERIDMSVPTRRLVEFVESAGGEAKTAGPLLDLANQFIPEERTDAYSPVAPWYETQSWGIVENLARRAIARYPDSPYAHLLLARSLRMSGLNEAAITELERTIAYKKDIFEAWQLLALLHQQQLSYHARRSPKRAVEELKEIEAFHAQAAEIWRDRPISPGIPQAYLTVSRVLFEAGKIERARTLLTRSIELEPQAAALDLLGTIEHKGGNPELARQHFERLLQLTFEHQVHRMRWEASTHLTLGQVAHERGDKAEATAQFQTALRQLNALLLYPGLSSGERAHHYVERGKLLFMLGDLGRSTADFRQARTLQPANPEVYTEPMMFMVSHGFYNQARELFRAAVLSDALEDSLKLYFCLWITELAQRQGQQPDEQAVTYLTNYRGSSWEQQLAAHATGKLTEDELLNTAKDTGEKAEAYFYVGLAKWRQGQAADAKALMQKVLGTKMMGFFEYEMARSYLRWDDLPAKARQPAAK